MTIPAARTLSDLIAWEALINQPPAEQHRYICTLLADGRTESDLANAFGVDRTRIRRRVILLRGNGGDVLAALKDMDISPAIFEMLRLLKPRRQIEIVGAMQSVNYFSINFAKALLAASRAADFVKPLKRKVVSNL